MNALVVQQPAAYALSDIERMARAFAASKLFGVQNAEQALALCLVAQAEGRHPATAAQDYSIIQNRPSKKADAMLRDFLAAGGKVEWHRLDNEAADATFSHPSGGTVRIDWTMERAKAAGLASNAMYGKYPRQMLRSRTVSEGVRTVCPGATSGMYVPEEVQDIVTETARDVTPRSAPMQRALVEPSTAPADDPVDRSADAVPTPSGDDQQDWNAWRLVIRAKVLKAASTDELVAIQRANADGLTACAKHLPDTLTIIAELVEKKRAKLGQAEAPADEFPGDRPCADADSRAIEGEVVG